MSATSTFFTMLGALERFSQLLEETEHFGRGRQKQVAKIVHCGEPIPARSDGHLQGGRVALSTHISTLAAEICASNQISLVRKQGYNC